MKASPKNLKFIEEVKDHIKNQCIQDVDGFYYWFPKDGGGCWNAKSLEIIAQHLNELNKEWEKHLNENL